MMRKERRTGSAGGGGQGGLFGELEPSKRVINGNVTIVSTKLEVSSDISILPTDVPTNWPNNDGERG